MSKKISQETAKQYIEILKNQGYEGLFQRAFDKIFPILGNSPDADIQLLDLAESFFSLFRRTGEEDYFVVGRALRRAAHAINRELLKKNKDKKINLKKFITRIK